MAIIANELKKGTRIRLDNGWEAVLLDKPGKGNIRKAEVYGAFTETGSIYVDKIVGAFIGSAWVGVTLDPEQKAFSDMKSYFGL